MYVGVQFPFKKHQASNLIVRVAYKYTKIFQTNKRCPFLVYFETIDPAELGEDKIEWERDIDYLKYELGIEQLP